LEEQVIPPTQSRFAAAACSVGQLPVLAVARGTREDMGAVELVYLLIEALLALPVGIFPRHYVFAPAGKGGAIGYF
jgi:hypothetical protein